MRVKSTKNSMMTRMTGPHPSPGKEDLESFTFDPGWDVLVFLTRVNLWGQISVCHNEYVNPYSPAHSTTFTQQIFIVLLLSDSSLTYGFRSDQISCSVVSDSLRPHESQHARPPCPSPTPGVHSDTSIKSVMPSSHLILCRLLLLLPPIPPSIRVFSNESTLFMRWPKY